MKKITCILLSLIILILVVGCSSGKKDYSGSYTVDEYYDLIDPAMDAAWKAIGKQPDGSDTEWSAELESEWAVAWVKEMSKLGFKGGEEITLSGMKGKLATEKTGSDEVVIELVNASGDKAIHVTGKKDVCGWALDLPEDTEMTVKFVLTKEYSFIPHDAEIQSPKK